MELNGQKSKEKIKNKGLSMYSKALLPIVVIAIVQIGICFAMFFLNGTINKLKNEQYSEFHGMVMGRSEKLQDLLSDKQEFVKYYKEKIETKIVQSMEAKGKPMTDLLNDEALNEEVTIELTGDIEDMLKGSRSTGAFLVLDSNGTYNNSELCCGYYLRNSKPGDTDERNFSVLRGSEELLKTVEYSVDENWRSGFRINNKKDNSFYNKIYNIFNSDEDEGSYVSGYWSPIFSLYGDDDRIITYSVPIVDEKGTFYGVLGIEISEQMLSDEMPYNEIDSNGSGSYYLVYRENDKGSYGTMVVSAASGKDVTNKDGCISYLEKKDKEYIYVVDENIRDDYIATVSNLELYKSQSPFAEEQWGIVGVANEQNLLSSFNNLIMALIVAVVLMIVVSALGIWYICFRFISYMRQITFSIRSGSPDEQLVIEPLHIRELDQLIDSIIELSERGTSSAKLAEIIDMVNIPIGAIEYKEDDNFVFCTQRAANILEFHHVDKITQYLSKKAFEVEADVLRKNLVPYEEEEDVYRMVSRTGSDKWIRIKRKDRDDRVLVGILDVTAEVLEKQKIEYERDYDILTRLLNRNAFRSRMGQLLKRGNLGVAAVVMMDLDNLKYFNDTYGHDYGDRYIREAAVVLSTLNQYNALVARMSGDEFLMFIFGYSSKDEIRKMVHDVHDRLLHSYITVPTGEEIRLRASAGIAWYPDDGTYLDELIKYADFAMYEIKSTKKGAIKEFNREVYQKDAVLFTGKEELNHLLEDPNMVRYIFQPIVEVESGEIFGYEALMRPQIDSLRSPEDVMRLAKAQSKLYQVEKLTWMAALNAVEQQRKHGDRFKIFINSVANHVLDDDDTEELEKFYHHLLERVIIEITESEQMDKSCMETKCEWAMKHGASIALDDFGTGYSNESTLLYINPNYVKLDMSIIKNIDQDEDRQKIVQGLLVYTKSHGIKVIAEGIDGYEEMRTLIRLGVDYMQGWYLSRGDYEIQDIPVEVKTQIRQCVRELEEE